MSRSDNSSSSSVSSSSRSNSLSNDTNCRDAWRKIQAANTWYFTPKFNGNNFYKFLRTEFWQENTKTQDIVYTDFVFNETKDKFFNGKSILTTSQDEYPEGYISLRNVSKIDIWNAKFHPNLIDNNLSSLSSRNISSKPVLKKSPEISSRRILRAYFRTVQFVWDPLNQTCQWLSIPDFFGKNFNEIIFEHHLEKIDFRWSEKGTADSQGEIIESNGEYLGGYFRLYDENAIETQYKINYWNAFYQKDDPSPFFSTFKFQWKTGAASHWVWCPIFFRGRKLEEFLNSSIGLISLKNIYWDPYEHSNSPHQVIFSALYSPGWIGLLGKDEKHSKELIDSWNAISALPQTRLLVPLQIFPCLVTNLMFLNF